MVISELRQNHGDSDDALAWNSLAPAHNAAATSHSISIQRVGRIDSPAHTTVAITAPTTVDPTTSCPAERALAEPASWPSITVFMMPDMYSVSTSLEFSSKRSK